MSRPWVKLYTEMLGDPKVGMLPDGAYRLFIELLLVAGEVDDNGATYTDKELAWKLSKDPVDMANNLDCLCHAGLVHFDDFEVVTITSWSKRQPPSTSAERVKRHRENKAKEASNGDVTLQKQEGNVLDKEEDKELEEEEDKEILLSESPTAITDAPVVNADYALFVSEWARWFPEKPQPRADNTTLQGKIRTRFKKPHFREHWQEALRRGSTSSFLLESAFFDASWFLHNDDNWEKVYNGKYDNKPQFKASSNGQRSEPKTFDQIRAENNRKATEDFKRLIRQGAGNG